MARPTPRLPLPLSLRLDGSVDLELAPPAPAILPLLTDRLAAGRSVWIQGQPGTGRTSGLLAVADQAAVVLRVDFATPGGTPLARLCAAFEEATGLPGWPDGEQITWAERGPGAALRGPIDEACRRRHGCDLIELRRLHGPEPAARLLEQFRADRWLAPPELQPPAEKLAALYDALPRPETVLVLLDNVDAALPERLAPLVQALAEELPRVYGQPWLVVAAGGAPAPSPRIETVELSWLDRQAAAWWAFDPPTEAERLATAAGWELLEGLVAGSTTPLAEAVEVLRELGEAGIAPPFGPVDIADAAMAVATAEARFPLTAARLDTLDGTAATAARLLLARAAAGLSPSLAGDELARLLEVDSARLARLLSTDDRFAVGDSVALAALDADEQALERLRREALPSVTAAACAAERHETLCGLATVLAGPVLWDEVKYDGEVSCVAALDPALAAPLPAQLGFRLVVVDSTEPLPPLPECDPRTIFWFPAEPDEEERSLAHRAALLRSVAEHAEPPHRQPALAALAAVAADLTERVMVALLSGEALAAPPLALSWAESLLRLDPPNWPAGLFRSRFRQLHYRRGEWLDTTPLDRPLDEAALAEAWHELAVAPRERGGAVRRALRLSAELEPPGFAWLRQSLEEHGGALDLPPLTAQLCAPPHGLTPPLAKLLLLGLVLRAEPPLTLETSGRGGLSRLTDEELRRLRWDDLAPAQLRRIIRGDRRGWSELLPFARVLEPDLGGLTTPSAVSAGRARLHGALARLRRRLTAARAALERLSTVLGQPLPRETAGALERLERLAQADSAEGFDAAVEAEFAGTVDELAAAYAALGRCEQVSEAVEPLCDLAGYLREVVLPVNHLLEADRMALRGQLDLARLLQNPSLVRGLLAQGGQFRRQFQATYQAAHRAHHEELAALRDEWEQVGDQHRALARLNEIRALGEPEADGVAAALEALDLLLRPCPVEPDASARPVCPACGWRFDVPAPAEHCRAVRDEVARAFAARTRRLAGRLTAEITQQLGHDRLEALHQVLALQQASRLPSVLTTETVELLEHCLPAEPAPAPLAELQRRHPTVGADEIEAVCAELRRLLESALAEAGEGARIPLR